jgi:cell wall-associated NlpC family hydrolase
VSRQIRSGRDWLAVVGAALALAAGLVAVPVAPAVAASPRLASAQARAAELRAAVDRLAISAESATEDYNAAGSDLAAVVTQHLMAQRQLEVAQAVADDRSDAAGDRMRALYEAGGNAALYASLLEGGSIVDLEARYRSVATIVDADRAAAAQAGGASLSAGRIEARLRELALRQTQLEARTAAAAARVRSLLAQTAQRLAAADVDVRRIAEADRRAAEAAAARAAAARIAAARAARQWSAPGALAPGATPAPTPAAGRAVAAALTRVGLPYLWGATGPEAFDCSGLTGWAYEQARLRLPRTSRQQWWAGRPVALAELAPGDLLFWATNPADPASIHHVAIYVGADSMVAAPHTGALVRVQPVYLDGYIGAVRPTLPALPRVRPPPGIARADG